MRYAAVIAIPVCTLLGLLLWQERDGADLVAVMPGGGVAILTTYDGTQVALDRTDGTAFDVHGNAVPIGNESVPASAEPADELPDPAYGQYNTIEIPRGGFYRVVLSDGSTVWLNNESRIRFPRRFDEHARVVTLEGEAYFQVEKDAQRPFIVQTGDYEIRVTGTRFNVRSYAPGTTTTTLVDGGVQIEMDGRVSTLAPNQQATIDNGVIAVREVKTEQYVAWQQGAFSFAQTRLDQIMDELSRWYDIEVEWKDLHARNYHFSAWFDRSSELSEIIEVLEKTNRVKMTLRGRTLTIRDK